MAKSLQEHFDYVVSNLLKQNARSGGPDVCLYRGPGNRKCAAGWLIDDAHYDRSIEGYGIRDAVIRRPQILPEELLGEEAINFVWEMQRAHDVYEPSEWPRVFADMAARHGLSDAVCKETA